MKNRNSFWFKLVYDLDLDDGTIEKFEKVLTHLNEDIISGSPVLSHVQSHLDELYKTIGGNRGSVAITPVPRHLRDLSNGMDVGYSTKDAQMFLCPDTVWAQEALLQSLLLEHILLGVRHI